MIAYFEKDDILHLSISDQSESGSLELISNVIAEFNDKGDFIGLEIINATSFVRDSILESAQAKLINLITKQAVD